jgi:energy-coupling factor transport system substrate-specific component
MKEVVSMWKNTRMIILVALSAAIYAAFLIVFKGGLVIVPGITEVRPANVFPAIFGLMFGPAGAWGAAIGNAIGDLFGGTFGIGSIFGFFGNFALAFVPYKMWGATLRMLRASDMSQTTTSVPKIIAFEIVALTGSVACAIIIAWYLELAKIVPFALLSVVISLNNFLAACVLGPILLVILYPRVKRWGLIWTDIMDKADVSAGMNPSLGAVLMVVGALGGLIAGLAVATGVAGEPLGRFTPGSGNLSIWAAVLPFLIVIVIASFMLSGREQFVDSEES